MRIFLRFAEIKKDTISELKPLNRILVLVNYTTRDSSFLTEETIVDTGAPVSVLPKWLWSQLDISFIGEDHIKGLVKRPECGVDVRVGIAECSLSDNKNTTQSFKLPVYCAESNRVIVLLGLKTLLDRFILHVDYRSKTAYLEEVFTPK